MIEFSQHPLHEAPALVGRDREGFVLARFADGVRRMSVDQLTAFWRLREDQIAREKEDPLRHEWEPEVWRKADGILDELRELLILGGNRSGKSSFAAKRMMRKMLDIPNGRFWAFSQTAPTSIEMQQPLLWKYMPPELRNARKSRVTNISYGQKTGFAENSFVLPNGAQLFFKHYSQDVGTIEGGEIDGCWCDELVPMNFLETLRYRLITRKGWLLLTFTPIEGYSAVVKEYLSGARTEEEREAELLPVYGEDESGTQVVKGYECQPVVQEPVKRKGRVLYFWTEDNPFSGYDALREELKGAKREEILCRAYGVPVKAIGNRFPKFSEKVHVVPEARVPSKGTDYHFVDPCGGRNWFMLWVRFDAAGRAFVFDEWPNQLRYIPGVGYPGRWAEPDGKKHDGKPGDAQRSFGYGLLEYQAEIEAVERERGADVFERYMDSRYGNAQTVAREAATTLIEECAEIGLNFLAAPGDAVNEGVDMINDWLSYDMNRPIDGTNAPKLYVSERCKNLIYGLHEWTGQDGKTGACKDPIDVLRYCVLSGASNVDGEILSVRPMGTY